MSFDQFFVAFKPGDYIITFVSIVLEATPFIVFGCILSGLLEELLPQRFLQRILPSNRFAAICASSMMGFLLPMCECGIVPVMRRLLAKGMPASCAVTYMLSAPVINPIVLGSTMLAFSGFGAPYDLGSVGGAGMALLRAGGAFITAVSVGLLFERMVRGGEQVARTDSTRLRLNETAESAALAEEAGVGPPLVQIGMLSTPKPHDHAHDHGPPHDHAHDHSHGHAHDHNHPTAPRSFISRALGVSEIALGDFLDIMTFLVIGAALAALVRVGVSSDVMERLNQYPILSIGAMMLFAFVISLCSEADAFVAANLTSLSVGSKLSFLLLGPMLDLKLFIMYQWVFTRRAVSRLIIALLILVFTLSFLVDVVFRYLGISGASMPSGG